MTHNRPTDAAERSSRARTPVGESRAPSGALSEPHTGAQPSDRITLNRHQLAALLAHHADVLAARWRAVAPGAGAWEVAAALSLTAHAGELTADEETPAVVELLDAILTFPTEQPPPADRSALRDRIRRAICEAEGFPWDTDMLEPDEYGDHADAVLAVLPDHTALDRVQQVVRRLAAHAAGFQDVLDDSDRGPWGSTIGADITELRDLTAAARPDDTTGA